MLGQIIVENINEKILLFNCEPKLMWGRGGYAFCSTGKGGSGVEYFITLIWKWGGWGQVLGEQDIPLRRDEFGVVRTYFSKTLT
jgi:hypothetical protein